MRVGRSISRVLNTITGGAEEDTLSERAFDRSNEGRRWACVLCRFLDVFEKDHCALAKKGAPKD
jgi:hypothetical protein